jgi:hypothetical protein
MLNSTLLRIYSKKNFQIKLFFFDLKNILKYCKLLYNITKQMDFSDVLVGGNQAVLSPDSNLLAVTNGFKVVVSIFIFLKKFKYN